MKRTFITLILLLSIYSLFGQTTFTVNAINYTTTGTATVQVSQGTYSGSISIPSKVTYLGISYSVTSIGDYAFFWCSDLTSVIIPNSVTSIGSSAFSFCWHLASITIPNSINLIGSSAFYSCSALTSVTIPTSLTSIGISVFDGCSGLTSITIPNSVTSIGSTAFNFCSSLTSVTIPSSVNFIGDGAFLYCKGLTSFAVSNNPSFCSVNGVLFDKNQTNLIQYPVGKIATNYTIPSSVTSIGFGAFCSCDVLTSIAIPSSVTSIGSQAFLNCTGLTSITLPSSVTLISENAFYGCSGLTSFTIPKSVSSIGIRAFEECTKLVSYFVDANNSTYSSKNGVLFNKNQTSLILYPLGNTATTYTIPGTVTSIEEFAFHNNVILTSVIIPNSVTTIGQDAFSGCSKLTKLNIPNSVTSIGGYAFFLSGLTSVNIPGSIVNIEGSAFLSCTDLTSIYAYNPKPSAITLGSSVFDGISKTTCTLYVPKGSKALYLAADQWKDFANIVEFNPTAVNTPNSIHIKIIINPVTKEIQIQGLETPSNVSVYNLSGKLCLIAKIATGDVLHTQSFTEGIYLIKINTGTEIFTQKITIK